MYNLTYMYAVFWENQNVSRICIGNTLIRSCSYVNCIYCFLKNQKKKENLGVSNVLWLNIKVVTVSCVHYMEFLERVKPQPRRLVTVPLFIHFKFALQVEYMRIKYSEYRGIDSEISARGPIASSSSRS